MTISLVGQATRFPIQFKERDDDLYRIIELPEELCNEEKLVIRGLENDEAILCSPKKSYVLKSVHISNSLLVYKQNGEDGVLAASDCTRHYYEVTPNIPDYSRMLDLMSTCLYDGQNDDYRKLYGEEELRQLMQMSDAEFNQMLVDLNVFEIRGALRMFSDDFASKYLQTAFAYGNANGWNLSSFPFDDFYCNLKEDGVDDAELDVISKVFRIFTERKNERRFDDGKVCRFIAKTLLKSKAWQLQDFMESWRMSTPDEFTPRISLISDMISFSENADGSQNVKYFPESTLPMDSFKRFDILFDEKVKWGHDEIVPFLRRLAQSEKEIEAILMKHCRVYIEPKSNLKFYLRK